VDVKIDRGDRDIEFWCSASECMAGPTWTSGGTLFSLHKLARQGTNSGKEFHDLSRAYEFLRHLSIGSNCARGSRARLPVSEAECRVRRRHGGHCPENTGQRPGDHGAAPDAAVERLPAHCHQQQTRGAAIAGHGCETTTALESTTPTLPARDLERLATMRLPVTNREPPRPESKSAEKSLTAFGRRICRLAALCDCVQNQEGRAARARPL